MQTTMQGLKHLNHEWVLGMFPSHEESTYDVVIVIESTSIFMSSKGAKDEHCCNTADAIGENQR